MPLARRAWTAGPPSASRRPLKPQARAHRTHRGPSRTFSNTCRPPTQTLSSAGKTTESTAKRRRQLRRLFEASISAGDFGKEGEIVKGTVVAVQRDNVVIDIGGKSEGIIALDEFADAQGQTTVKAGDDVDVYIESRENDDGLVTLSKEKADKMKVWDEISAACERDELIEGTISQRVKGGLSVTIRGGVKAFLPGSQVDLRPIRNLDKLIGQTYQFKVIKFNKKRGNIVLSRRVLLEKERDEHEDARPSRRSRRARSSRASSRTSPSTARSSTSAASTACSTSPT